MKMDRHTDTCVKLGFFGHYHYNGEAQQAQQRGEVRWSGKEDSQVSILRL